MYESIQQKEIRGKIVELFNKIKNCTVSMEDHALINDIDDTFMKLCIETEREVTKRKYDEIPWYPKLAQAYIIVHIWLVIKHQIEKDQTEQSVKVIKVCDNMEKKKKIILEQYGLTFICSRTLFN